MLTSFGSGEIWKGSNQEISVVLVPRCYKVEGEITDVVINFYTTAGGTSIEFSGDTVTVSGINATVVFQPVQLDALDDGLIRYNVAFNEGGESHVFDLETRYMLKTPNDYEPVDYVTHAEVEGVVDELLVEKMEDYYTSGETNEVISNAMAAETARTESTYLKEHQSLADYWTSAQTESAITAAIEAQSGTTSAQTQEMITEAMAAETARTEQTYLKEHQSLADYWTSAQTESAITEATSGIVKTLNISTATSGECMEFYNYAMSHHDESYTILYHLDSGDDGFAQATEITFDGNNGGIYLTFFRRSGKYVFALWQGGTSISIFNEENYVTTDQKATTNDLGLIKVGSGLTIDNDGVLSVSGGTGGGGLAVYDFEVITGDSTARTELINLVSGGTQTAVVAKDGVMYYYRGYDEGEFKYVFVDYKNVILPEQPQHSNRFYFRAIKVDANQAYQDWFEQDISFDVQQWMYTTDYYSKQSVSTNGFLYASDNTYDIIPGSTPKVGETYTNIYFTIPGMLWVGNGLTVTVNGDSHNISWWGGKTWNVDGDIYDENHTTEAGMTVDFSYIDGTGHGYIGISAAAMTVTQVPENGEGGGTSVSVPILATTNLQMYRNGEWNSISAIPNLVYSGASQGILASAVSTVKAGLYNGTYAGNDTFYILINDLSQEAQSILYESESGVSETVTLKTADYIAVITKNLSNETYSLSITEKPVSIKNVYFDSMSQAELVALFNELYVLSGVTKPNTSNYRFMHNISNNNSFGSVEVFMSKIEKNKINFEGLVTYNGNDWFFYGFRLNSDGTLTNTALNHMPLSYLQRTLTPGTGITIDNDNVISCTVSGADLSDYWTSAQTQSAITDAISGIDLGDYYTSAQTDNKIAEAVSAVTFSGVTQPILDATMAAETARTEQTYLKQGALADYYTSGETNEAISNAIAAETARTESTYLKEHQSLDNYYTKAQTDSAITNAINTESARTNTAIANAIAAETARTEQTYLKQGALADYYTSAQTNTAISNAVSDKVSSSTITQIWTGSQQAYDAMTGHSANILYIINS